MNELKVTGKQQIGSIEFTGIEGGFGEDKKAMLVKDIAEIHQTDVRTVNQSINRNINRFKEGKDIIDLKSAITQSDNEIIDFGFTQNAFNASKNIYLLSERGYAKLLKILEDDKAWDIYDELVDNYFNMRLTIKDNQPQLVANKRLEIMEENAKTRKAQILYKLAMATESNIGRERFLAEAGKAITGEMVLPIMKQKEYSATDIAEKLGITANKVGRIANSLVLKAEQPNQNEYGRWANGTAKGHAKDVAVWVYTEKGLNAIKKELNK